MPGRRCCASSTATIRIESPGDGRGINQRHHLRLATLPSGGELVSADQSDEQEGDIAPTILRKVSPDSPVMQDEIFGPTLAALPVARIDAAISFVNARPKPLALCVFIRRKQVAEDILPRTSSGGVRVNATVWRIANSGLLSPGGDRQEWARIRPAFVRDLQPFSRSMALDLRIACPPWTPGSRAHC